MPKIKKQIQTDISKSIERVGLEPSVMLRTGEFAIALPARYSRDEPVLKRNGLHNVLVDKRRISEPQWEWAERFCREIEVLNGARDGVGGMPSDISAGPKYDRGVAAAAFIRAAQDRLNDEARFNLLIAACVLAMRITEVANMIGLKRRDDEDERQHVRRTEDRVHRRVAEAIVDASGIKEREVA